MRYLIALHVLVFSSSLSLAEVSQDCQVADPLKAISGCTAFLQNPKLSKTDRALAHVFRADAFMAQRQLDAAERDLKEAFDIGSSAAALTVRARLHFQRSNFRKALADLDAALRQSPSSVSARRLRGIVQIELTSYPAAKKDLDWVIANSPSDHAALANRGRLHRLLNETDKSLADLNRALAISPKWPWALLQRADTYQLKGDHKSALADYDRVLAIAPNDADAKQRRAAALALLNPGTAAAPVSPNPGPAASDGPKPASPANVRQWLQQARNLLGRGEVAGAFTIVNKLLKVDPNLAEAYYIRGRVFHHEHLYTQAAEDLNKYVAMKPDDVAGRYSRGLLLADRGSPKEALSDADQIERLLPGDPRSHAVRGWAHFVAGRYAESEEAYTAAINIKPADFVYVNRAMARIEQGKYDHAETDLSTAFGLNARNARTLSTRGQLLVRTGRIEQGESSFRDALAIDAKNTTARIGQQALFTVRALKQIPVSEKK